MRAPLDTLPGAGWACTACGDCCRGYTLGPVHADIIHALAASDLPSSWAPAREGWSEERVSPDGRSVWFLKHVDGHCVFLADDNRCAVHASLGEAAKPAFCREFPFHLSEDLTGVRATVRPDCSGFARTFDGDQDATAAAHAAAALPSPLPRRRFAPEHVAILPDASLPLADWLVLERELIEALSGVERLAQAQELVRQRLFAAAGRPAPALDPALGRRALAAVLAALGMVLPRALNDEGGAPHQIVFLQARIAELPHLQSVASADPPPLDPRAERYAVLVLRSALHARTWESAGSVSAGLGRLALHCAIAQHLAQTTPQGTTATAWARAYIAWSRLFANGLVGWVLTRAKPALEDALRYGVIAER